MTDTSGITDLFSCAAYIRKNGPMEELVLSREIMEQIRRDADSMHLVKSPRPEPHSKENPWGTIDRELWDAAQQMKQEAPFKVYGVLLRHR